MLELNTPAQKGRAKDRPGHFFHDTHLGDHVSKCAKISVENTHRREYTIEEMIQEMQKLMKTALRGAFRENILVSTRRGSRICPPATCRPRKMIHLGVELHNNVKFANRSNRIICFVPFEK